MRWVCFTFRDCRGRIKRRGLCSCDSCEIGRNMTRQVNKLSKREGQARVDGDEDSCRFLRTRIRSCHKLAKGLNKNCSKCDQRHGAIDIRQKVLKRRFDEGYSHANPVSLKIIYISCTRQIVLLHATD